MFLLSPSPGRGFCAKRQQPPKKNAGPIFSGSLPGKLTGGGRPRKKGPAGRKIFRIFFFVGLLEGDYENRRNLTKSEKRINPVLKPQK